MDLKGGCNALMVELMALREALSWTSVYYRGRLEIELDSQEAVTALNKGACEWTTEESILVEECWDLAKMFHSTRFTHIRREGNRVAHTLAQMALNQQGFREWLEETPTEIEEFYLREVA